MLWHHFDKRLIWDCIPIYILQESETFGNIYDFIDVKNVPIALELI